MKTLVLNCGSSSIKYKLFDMASGEVMAQGGIERVGLEDSFLKFTDKNEEKVTLEKSIPNHEEGIAFILRILTDQKYGCIKSYNEIDAVGHRVVHGGEKFASSVLITQEVIDMLVECTEFAPLHNPANLEGIRAIDKILPDTPQVGVFDTAFHQSIPDYAYLYAFPYDVYEKYGVRRYGFHGTSHRYVSNRACEILGVPYEQQRIITAHIGNGGSVTAVKNGKSIDTSMGMTPTEGLIMGTRCGDVDAGALPYIMRKKNLDAEGLSDYINKKSGVAGFSEISSDMRDIERAMFAGNPRAIQILNMYNYRIKKYVGAYSAALGGLDILVFTGGVGENQWVTRAEVCKDMEYLGLIFDEEKNKSERGREVVISKPESKVKVMVVPTDEEYMIAYDTRVILEDK
ncbi:MAG TPA: acetate kinase [Porphyromonadaceae bacterium]|nr:acetate kinase [Porphyromonadaceae bacterium]